MTASSIAAATVNFNPETRLFVDGRLRDSSTGKTVENVNPANEEVLGLAVLEERVQAARQEHVALELQRRDPRRVGVQPKWERHERA